MDSQFFQQLFEKHNAIMLLIEPNSSQVIYSNQAACFFYGYSQSEMGNLSLNELSLAPATEIAHTLQAAIRGEITQAIAPHRQASGEVRTVELHLSPTCWADKTLLFATIHDITERVEAQESLQRSEQKFRTKNKQVAETLTKHRQLTELLGEKETKQLLHELFEAIPTPIFYKNIQGKYLAWNQASVEVIGKSADEVMGQTLHDIYPETIAQQHEITDLTLISQPDLPHTYEYEAYHHKLQEERTFLLMKSLIKDAHNQPLGILGIIIDITERKRAERALQINEERWQFALEGVGDGVWDWNVQTNEVFYSRRWKEMLGYAEDELTNDFSTWEKLVHPEDKANIDETTKAHFRGETAAQIHESRVLHKDGTYRWIQSRGKVMSWTKDGQPLRMVGTHTDITERKKTDEILQATQMKLAHLATHDFLTGLHNRVRLTEKLTEAINQRGKHLVAVMMIDMDNFKRINDNYGHQEGDRLLIEIATRLKAIISETDMVFRLGGDEFLLIITQLESMTQAEQLVKRILMSGRRQFQLGHVAVSPNFSLGIALCPLDSVTPETLLVSSDRALYQAKSMGRNGYAFAYNMSHHLRGGRSKRRIGSI